MWRQGQLEKLFALASYMIPCWTFMLKLRRTIFASEADSNFLHALVTLIKHILMTPSNMQASVVPATVRRAFALLADWIGIVSLRTPNSVRWETSFFAMSRIWCLTWSDHNCRLRQTTSSLVSAKFQPFSFSKIFGQLTPDLSSLVWSAMNRVCRIDGRWLGQLIK